MNREKTHQKDRPPFYQLQGRTGDIDDLIFKDEDPKPCSDR